MILKSHTGAPWLCLLLACFFIADYAKPSLPVALAFSFQSHPKCHSRLHRQTPSHVLFAARDDNNKNDEGYKLGDISRGLLRLAGEFLINESSKIEDERKNDGKIGATRGATGNSSSGSKGAGSVDLDDKSILSAVFNQIGEVATRLDLAAKDQAMAFTNKESYQFGDVTREALRRIRTGDYTTDDLMLLLKLVVAVGANFTPLAKLLPAKALIELFNLSLTQSVGERVRTIVLEELTKRTGGQSLKNLVSGYIGDELKSSILQSVDKRAPVEKTNVPVENVVAETKKHEEYYTKTDDRSTGQSNAYGTRSSDESMRKSPRSFEEAMKEIDDWDAAFQAMSKK